MTGAASTIGITANASFMAETDAPTMANHLVCISGTASINGIIINAIPLISTSVMLYKIYRKLK